MKYRVATFLCLILGSITVSVHAASVVDVIPRSAPRGARLVVVGAGLDASGIEVTFAAGSQRIAAPVLVRTATLLEVQVPQSATTGDLQIVDGAATLMQITFTVTATPAFVKSAMITAGDNSLKEPVGLYVALPGGITYITDSGHHQIKAVFPNGAVQLLAGTGKPGLADGPGTTARFHTPQAVTIDRTRNILYIADSGNHAIRMLMPDGTVSTFAGSRRPEDRDGAGQQAGFNHPTGLTIDHDGNLYVADTGNHKIKKITPAGVVTTVAGTGRPGLVNGSSLQALLKEPRGIAISNSGILYVADSGNHVIRKVENGVVSTFAGTGHPGSVDGDAGVAEFKDPAALAADESGELFVADSGNHQIRRIADGFVSTISGNGYKQPAGIAIEGALFIADTKNGAIRALYRSVSLVDVHPRSGGPNGGETVRLFGAGFVPGQTTVTFGGASAQVAYVSSTELLVTVPPSALGAATIAITTPGGMATLSDLFQYVPPFVSLAISPSSPSIDPGQTVQLSAFGTAADGTRTDLTSRVTWSSSDATIAAVSASGLVTAGRSGTVSITVHFGQLTSSNVLTVRDPEPLPPDPATVAPAIDPRISTSYSDATRFLYTGPGAIQQGVTEGAIQERLVSVIRGKVISNDGMPLPGVEVTIAGHPEYGRTKTRADGMFDLAANGGGSLTLHYEKSGYLSVDRTVSPRWRDYANVSDVLMLRLDPNVTTISASASVMQIARGSVVTDSDGTRRATALFQPGTSASLVLPDGSTRPLNTLHVRATEYTVGTNGVKAMPAALPAQSGYTYCVELSADEALEEDGATVAFSKPVIFYVENFLGFPVGGAVPAGYYDRKTSKWIASKNGKIVKILAVSGGTASLDSNGDGAADDASVLTSLGVTPDELQRLATLYTAGQSLWRVPIPHFTPWDCNWPYGPPPGAEAPDMVDPFAVADIEAPNCQLGSIIECETLTLGERVPIAGTPYRLSYRSDRVPGYRARRTITVPLTNATIPTPLRRVDIKIEVAGRQFEFQRPAAPQQSLQFEWDGFDAYGRAVAREVMANVDVGYVYRAVYQTPAEFASSFGALSGVPITGDSTRNEIVLWQKHVLPIGTRPADDGGWSLDVHQTYDAESSRMYPGGAPSWSAQSISDVIETAVGTGKAGFKGDGGLATLAEIHHATGPAVAPNGDLYFGDYYNFRVRRVRAADGVIETVAGNGIQGFSGDGGPATKASLDFPATLAFGPEGDLYIGDYFNCRVRRVRNGIIETVAGNGCGSDDPHGRPALETPLLQTRSVAVGNDGTIYIAQVSAIVAVGTDGMIRRITARGFPANPFQGDGGPAINAPVNANWIATASDGSLYVFSGSTIRRISPDGIINTIAGNSIELGFSGDGGLARNAQIWAARGTVGPDGSVYFAGYRYDVIRRIRPDGIIERVAGTGRDNGIDGQFSVVNGDGGPARNAGLGTPQDVAVRQDGILYITGVSRNPEVHKIRRVMPAAAGISGNGAAVPSRDGGLLFVFDSHGRHLRTEDTSLGVTVQTFEYDTRNRLIGLIDVHGKRTRIERDGSGQMSKIIAPAGEETLIDYDANGWIRTFSGPGNQTVHCEYTSHGLLTSFRTPRGYASTFTYDSAGLLQTDHDAGTGFKTLSRSGTGEAYYTTVTSALGRRTQYSVQSGEHGSFARFVVLPSGASAASFRNADFTTSETLPDDTIVQTAEHPDPRFGMRSPLIDHSIQTPEGRLLRVHNTRLLTFSGGNISAITDQSDVNGKRYSRILDRTARTITEITPMGRQRMITLDALGRPVRVDVPGFAPAQLTYDAGGRPALARFGTHETSFGYDTRDRLSSVTDALSRTTTFAYDDAGRVTKQTLIGARELSFSYDLNGNLLTLLPPGRPAHEMTYTNIDLVESYRAPGAAVMSYSYNADQDLTAIAWPDTALNLSYDGAGRIATIVTDAGKYNYGYSWTGALSSIIAPGGIGLSFSYDGPLLTETRWSGPVSGFVSYIYDNDFNVTTEGVSGDEVSYAYDADGLLTDAGVASLQRDSANGRVLGTTVGYVADAISMNNLGEVTSYAATRQGAPLLSFSYTRDAVSRLTKVVETFGGSTSTTEYDYDASGRLSRVKRAGAVIAEYDYDANGNRLNHRFLGGSNAATYDDQDRLLTYGNHTYTYSPDGSLLTNSVGGQTSTFRYDRLGNLRSAQVGGRSIEYIIDGQNRRIGKKVDGVLVQALLYGDQLRPLAELDATGKIVSRFVYAERANVPTYMVRDEVTYRILADHLGSPRLIVHAISGAVVQQITYDEFGNVLADTNPGFQPFGFAGGLYDRDTGLIRFGARDYDPHVGRFVTKDPIGFAGGDTNLYAYVLNDPVNLIDPTGLHWTDTAASFSAGLGDTLLFGFGDELRDWTDKQFGWNGGALVDECSGAYSAGEWTGVAVSTALGAGSGYKAAVTRVGRGYEWSHFIPGRYATQGIPRVGWRLPRAITDSSLNGRFLSAGEHALNDPVRYGFTSKFFKNVYRPNSGLAKWAARTPQWIPGGAAGAAYGAAGSSGAGSECGCR